MTTRVLYFRNNRTGESANSIDVSGRTEREIERLRAGMLRNIGDEWDVCDSVYDGAADAAYEIERLRIALADAIRRPMGVIPASAEVLITAADLDAAEKRRPRT